MRITGLYAENFMKIKCVEIKPDGTIVEISGKNGNGKSCVLKAVWAIIEWKAASKKITNPVRDGEDKATLECVIDDKYKATRTITKDSKQTIKIVDIQTGNIITKPQTILNNWMKGFGEDPFEMTLQYKDAGRIEKIASIINDKLGVDIHKFDREIAVHKEARKELNRDKKREQSRLDSMLPPQESEPDEKIDILTTTAELADARSKLSVQADNLVRRQSIESDIKAAEEQLSALKNKLTCVNTEIVKNPAPAQEKITDLEEKITNVERINSRVLEIQEYNNVQITLQAIEGRLTVHKKNIELQSINKAEAVERVDLGIEGFKIDDGTIYVNGVPFSDLSDAEKIITCMKIIIASDPELRVMRIEKGSLLDEYTLKQLEEIAEKYDFQIWLELVDSTGLRGFYLEDGELV